MQKEVRLIAPLHNNSGYGKAGKGILAALLTQGYAVEAIESEANTHCVGYADGTVAIMRTPFRERPMHPAQRHEVEAALATKVSPDAPTILLGTPEILNAYPEYPDKRIAVTMWEVNNPPQRWRRRLGNADSIVLPSRWNAEQICDMSPKVVPLCVDERFWSEEGELYPVADVWRPAFLFVSVFYVSERKNWQEMIAAFAEEFWGENVGLLIRAGGENQYLVETVNFYKRMGVKIEVVTDELTEEELAGLYRLGDCFVLPSTEGFGMPYVEAALCGTPSIGLDGQAGAETVHAVFGRTVDSYPAMCFSRIPHLYSPQMSHLKPCYQELRANMREAVNRPPDSIAANTQPFSRASIGAQLAEAIEELRARPVVTPVCAPKNVPLGVVVMLTHNHLEQTQVAVQSLLETAPQCALVVVDDGSEDGTVDWLRSLDLPHLHVLESPTRNISKNWNAGVDWLLKQGFVYLNEMGWDGPIVFSDNDIEYRAGWYEALWAVMESDSSIGIVAPVKCLPDGDVQNCGNWLSDKAEGADNRMLRQIYEADYVETACMMVRPELWKRLRMDEQFPIFYNDADYCFQARGKGYRAVGTRLSSVTHHAHTTSPERAAESLELRNAFIRKWKETLRG